ncbi:hypothetical protein F5Y08DRAFT_314929 [Xylaria arbuscula]|nr:hypothetical protein F5Y08DRAFT_314929 [Xylaria arbuscula]
MKLNVAVLCLALAVSVSARGSAGAYERLYYWFVYRAEVTVYGSDSDKWTMGGGCMGSGTHDSCTFNQFINWVSNGEADENPSYPETNFNPTSQEDINNAADSLSDAINSGDLEDVVASRVNKNAKGWFATWRNVAHATYAAKAEVVSRGDSVNTVIGDELKMAEFCLNSVDAYRRLDHFEKMRTHFNNKFPDLTVVWRVKTTNEIEWREIDVPATHTMNYKSGYTLTELQDEIDDFNTGEDADEENKKHWDILVKVDKAKKSCPV